MESNLSLKIIKLFKCMENERYLLKHPFVGSEHLFLAMLKIDKNIIDIFEKNKVNYNRFKSELVKIVGIPKKNVEFNLYTPLLKRIISNSILDAKENKEELKTKHLLLAMLEEGEGIAIRILSSLEIDLDDLYDDLDYNKASKRDISFGKNLNLSIDQTEHTVGRDKEIESIIETLLRKKKSNPLLIGDAGVGKTAIVEELVRKINRKEVPKELENTKVISLEMSSLIAGTKYRGEFEEKLSKIIEELENDKNSVVFIDEIHTMVSAGGAEGAICAGDIFKPSLARGKIKCIGATTTEEYDKYISKDKALSRRFETINIKEPTVSETVNILNKIKGEYEKHHNIKISKKNIELIVFLADKYIFNKKNPDKSIDFLDSICTKVHVKSDNKNEINKLLSKISKLKKDKELSVKNSKFDDALKIREKEIKLENKLKNLYENKDKKISDKDIYSVLESKTKLPFLKSKDECINNLDSILRKKLVGQSCALEKIVKNIECKLNHLDKTRSFLLEGQCGTGKSFTLNILENYFKSSMNIIKIDGKEYTSDSSLSKLIGTTAGYVGYDDQNIFSSVKYNPFSLVIVENYNYLSPVIENLFKQICEEGYITNSKGERLNFNSSILIGTVTKEEKKKVGFNSESTTENINSYFDDKIFYKNISKEDILYYLNINKYDINIIDKIDYTKNGYKNINKYINN